MKSFFGTNFITYINHDSDFKYRIISNLGSDLIIDYINDNLDYYWRSFKVPLRLNKMPFLISVSNSLDNKDIEFICKRDKKYFWYIKTY